MRTLVVVSALVSLAIAAPTLPEDGTESMGTALNGVPLQVQTSLIDSLTKERTPSEIVPVTHLHNGAPNADLQNVQLTNDGPSMPMARSFLLKKPLIVKKKYGYQLYRDSEEEKAQADSDETCGRQVKVKLCNENEKYRATMGSTDGNVQIHSSDDDVKHSIKMAKEAVENLQRDLKKMEMKTEMKTAHDSQSDIELHEDIEVARQALKHIHDNFENLDTMSLRATTTRNSEDMHDVHLTIAKTEEERMAQWKEALENIQKNVEIARNIEDSFKAANNQENLVHLDQSNAAPTINFKMEETALLPEADQLRLTKDADLEVETQERTTQEQKTLENTMNEHMNEQIARKTQNADDDMNFAPSEMIEVHLDNKRHHESLKSESHKITENAKSAEFELEDPKTFVETKDLVNVQQIEDHPTKEKSAEIITETLENLPTPFVTTNDNMKPLTLVPVTEQQRTVEMNESITENQQDNLKKMDSDDISDFILRSAVNTDEQKMIKEDIHNEHVAAKEVEDLNPEQTQLLTETWELKSKEALPTPLNEVKHFDAIPKSTETLENTHFQMTDNERAEKFLQEQLRQQWLQQEELNQMKALHAMRTANDNLLQNQKSIFWGRKHRKNEQLPSVKAAEDIDQFETTHLEQEQGFMPESTMDHFRNSYLPEHTHVTSKMGSSHISDDMRTADGNLLQNQKSIFWGRKHRKNEQLPTMKAAEDIDQFETTHLEQEQDVMPESTMDHFRNSYLPEHTHVPSKMGSSHISDDMRTADGNVLQNQKSIFWGRKHRKNEQLPTMKAAEDIDQFETTHLEQEQGFMPESTMDHFRNSYLPEHSHVPSKMGSSHISDLTHSHHHSHFPARYHQNSMAHQHMHEMTGMDSAMHPHYLPHMRDAMEGFESEHTFHWQPTHESARTAYGSALSSSISPSGLASGAVGVFPNANVGGCGIPLLLSCSPSVVSGSLAKAHSAGPSSYSAPSYRTEDDFSFLTKRGIDMNDMRTTNAMRTMTTTMKQKTPMTVENKV
ncbi:uncharacterized protein LOC118266990 [Spodoptera frugiperda]|uniref:Uncharacterized protein LOC118266990 n=1 Tax=Spodoptera frugiperda TaxID=7108 RepID=A0A9R0D177_SPOFR|nr:uncharacterized protein LOC118266990 [Spodoptera frugiperda]